MEVGTEVASYVYMYYMYVIEKKGVTKIARELKCRNGTVCDLLAKYGLSKTNGGNVPKEKTTKEWFLTEYVEKERTIEDIGEELHLDESSIRYHLRKYDIPIRYKTRGSIRNDILNDKEWLYEQFITKLRTIHSIADEAECNVSSVVQALVRFDISRHYPLPRQGTSRSTSRKRRSFVGKKREAILTRDKHQCQFPDCTAGEHLELHHIIPIAFGGEDSVDNGITLCKLHHRGIAFRETDYISLFLSIIGQEPPA